MLESPEAKVLFAIIGAMVDKSEPTMKGRRPLRRIGLADDIIMIIGWYLFSIKIERIAQQHPKLAVVLIVDDAVEIGRSCRA